MSSAPIGNATVNHHGPPRPAAASLDQTARSATTRTNRSKQGEKECKVGDAVNPGFRYGAALVCWKGHTYLIGGAASSVDVWLVDDPKDRTTWQLQQTVGKQPSPRTFFSCCDQFDSAAGANYGTCFLTGGIAFGTTVVDDLYELRLSTMTWSLLPQRTPLAKRHHHATACLGGRLYLFGGISIDGRLIDGGDLFLTYESGAKTWGEALTHSNSVSGAIADRPGPRSHHAMCAAGGALFVYGGVGPGGEILGDLWRFRQLNKAPNVPLEAAGQYSAIKLLMWERIRVSAAEPGNEPWLLGGPSLGYLPRAAGHQLLAYPTGRGAPTSARGGASTNMSSGFRSTSSPDLDSSASLESGGGGGTEVKLIALGGMTVPDTGLMPEFPEAPPLPPDVRGTRKVTSPTDQDRSTSPSRSPAAPPNDTTTPPRPASEATKHPDSTEHSFRGTQASSKKLGGAPASPNRGAPQLDNTRAPASLEASLLASPISSPSNNTTNTPSKKARKHLREAAARVVKQHPLLMLHVTTTIDQVMALDDGAATALAKLPISVPIKSSALGGFRLGHIKPELFVHAPAYDGPGDFPLLNAACAVFRRVSGGASKAAHHATSRETSPSHRRGTSHQSSAVHRTRRSSSIQTPKSPPLSPRDASPNQDAGQQELLVYGGLCGMKEKDDMIVVKTEMNRLGTGGAGSEIALPTFIARK